MLSLLTAIVAIGMIGIGIWLWFTNLARFLNPTAPVQANILLIEGWLPDQTIEQASKLFWEDGYQAIVTTGPPLQYGYFLTAYKTHAALSAATLVALGIPEQVVTPLPCPAAERFRTYTSALAVKQYCQQQVLQPSGINIYTACCHARRSWYIYRQLFADTDIQIGIVGGQPGNFDLQHWWTTSAGVRVVLGEFIAYIYVRLINWKS